MYPMHSVLQCIQIGGYGMSENKVLVDIFYTVLLKKTNHIWLVETLYSHRTLAEAGSKVFILPCHICTVYCPGGLATYLAIVKVQQHLL